MYKRNKFGGSTRHLLVILSVILAAILGTLLYYSNIKEMQREASLKVLLQQEHEKQSAQKEEEQRLELALQEKRESDSFYQKLADGFDVNILVVGDSIGAGTGSSDSNHNWSALLKNEITATYGSLVTLTNVSMGGNASYAGYVRTLALDDNNNYDLVVLCYGQNDMEENFSLYYEALVRAIKNRYPKASLLAILESSQKEYSMKMQAIQDIASHYSIPVVDTIAPFQMNYESLTGDGVHPNDDGYKVYCETAMNTINDLVSESYGFDPNDVYPVNDRVTDFDEFQWIGSEQFTRDNNTFTLNKSLKGTILGIDYDFVSGTNSCKIIIDGEEYAAPEVSFDYDLSQRHIMVVNNWLDGDVVDVQNEIKVVFADDENGQKQADGFRGLAISG